MAETGTQNASTSWMPGAQLQPGSGCQLPTVRDRLSTAQGVATGVPRLRTGRRVCVTSTLPAMQGHVWQITYGTCTTRRRRRCSHFRRSLTHPVAMTVPLKPTSWFSKPAVWLEGAITPRRSGLLSRNAINMPALRHAQSRRRTRPICAHGATRLALHRPSVLKGAFSDRRVS